MDALHSEAALIYATPLVLKHIFCRKKGQVSQIMTPLWKMTVIMEQYYSMTSDTVGNKGTKVYSRYLSSTSPGERNFIISARSNGRMHGEAFIRGRWEHNVCILGLLLDAHMYGSLYTGVYIGPTVLAQVADSLVLPVRAGPSWLWPHNVVGS